VAADSTVNDTGTFGTEQFVASRILSLGAFIGEC
jgi:hypothetical protein